MAMLNMIFSPEAFNAPADGRKFRHQDTSKVDEEEHSETGLAIASSPLMSSPTSTSIIVTSEVPLSTDHHGLGARKPDTGLVALKTVKEQPAHVMEEASTRCTAQVSGEVDTCPVVVNRPQLASPSWSEDSGEGEDDDDDWAWVGTDLFVDAAREAAESLEDEDEDEDVVHAGTLIDEDDSDVEGADNYTTDEEDAREASDSEDESLRALSPPCIVEPTDASTGPASEVEEIARLIEPPPSMPSFTIKIPPLARSRQQAERYNVEGIASSSRLTSSHQSTEERVEGKLVRRKKRTAAEVSFADENEDLAESSTGRRVHRPKRLRRSYSPPPSRESGGHRTAVLQDAVNLISEEESDDGGENEVAEAQSQAPAYTLADIAAIRQKVQGCVPSKGCEVTGEQAGDIVLHPLYNYRRPYRGAKKACGWAGCGTSFRHLSREDIRDHLLEHCSRDPGPEKTKTTSGSEFRETSSASGSLRTEGASGGEMRGGVDKKKPSGKKSASVKTNCLWTGCRQSAPMDKDALMKHLETVHAKLTELICVLPSCTWSGTQQNFTHGRHCVEHHRQSKKDLALVLRGTSNAFILLPVIPTRMS